MTMGCSLCGSLTTDVHKPECPRYVKHLYPERPAVPDNSVSKAALEIRKLHERTLDMMEGGHVFEKNGKDVNREVKAFCLKEIEAADHLIKNGQRIHDNAIAKGGFASLHLADVTDFVKEQEAQEAPAPAANQIDVVRADDVAAEIGSYGKH